jgi:hypothetical protein
MHTNSNLKRLGALAAAALPLAGLPTVGSAAPAPAASHSGLPAGAVCYKAEGGAVECVPRAARVASSVQCYHSGDRYSCFPASHRVTIRTIPPGAQCEETQDDLYVCATAPIPSPPPPPPPPMVMPP